MMNIQGKSKWVIAGVALLFSLLGSNAEAVTYVDSEKYDTGTGTCLGTCDGKSWATAYYDLQAAINDAEEDTTELAAEPVETEDHIVWVKAGTYFPSTVITIEALSYVCTDSTGCYSFEMKPGVAVYGGFSGSEDSSFDLGDRDFKNNETILSGDVDKNGGLESNSYHVIFNFGNGLDHTAVLDGCTVKDGNARGAWPHSYGGAIVNYESSPTLRNIIFKNNYAIDDGAALYSHTLIAEQKITNCVFVENTAKSLSGGTGRGGGAYTCDAFVTFQSCKFYGNRSILGGGLYIDKLSSGVSTTVVNCIFTCNVTETQGGAIYNRSSLELINSSLTGNNAIYLTGEKVQNGGGIYNDESSTRMKIKNSIVYGNTINGVFVDNVTGGTFSEIKDRNTAETDVSYSNIRMTSSEYPGTGNMNTDPQFYRDPDYSATDYGDLHLHTQANLCIGKGVAYDAVNHPEVPQVDFENEPRVGLPDIGADQFVDSEEDGMPDYWEEIYRDWPGYEDGLDPAVNDADGDLDGDGKKNLEEYESGFDPTGNVEPVAIIRVKPDALVSCGKLVTLQSDSYDLDDTDMSWAWEQIDPGANPVVLTGETDESATFTTPDLAPGLSIELRFRLTVTSGGDTDTATCVVTVEKLNEKPVLEVDWGSFESGSGYVVVEKGTTLTGQLSITEASADIGETITYSATGGPGGILVDSETGDVTLPTAGLTIGTYYVTFHAVDDGAPPLGDSKRLALIIKEEGQSVNRPPAFDFPDSYQCDLVDALIPEDQRRFITTATDPEGDTLSYSASDMPPGASYNTGTGEFELAEATPAGNYDVLFSVWDGNGGYDHQTVTITVGDINRPPVLTQIGHRSVVVGETLTFTVTATDPDDPSGEGLTFSASNLPAGAAFDHKTQVFTWDTTGVATRDYDVTFTVIDDGNPIGSDSEDVTLTVETAPIDYPPVLEPIGNKSIDESEGLSFGVFATDRNGDPITYNITCYRLNAGGNYDSWNAGDDGVNFTYDATGALFSWDSADTATGSYKITFTAFNDKSDSETIIITVGSSSYNTPPYFSPEIQDLTFREGETISLYINARDTDGDPLSYRRIDTETVGSFDTNTRMFTWQTDSGDEGNYQFRFDVNDGKNPYVEMGVGVTIGKNDPPTLSPIADQSGEEGDIIRFSYTASDPDGDPLFLSVVGLPAGASAGFDRETNEGEFYWATDNASAGVYSLEFRVSDTFFEDTQTITITIADVGGNRPPVIETLGGTVVEDGVAQDWQLQELNPFTSEIVVSDPDSGTVLSYSAYVVTDGGVYGITDYLTGATFDSETGAFAWTPPAGSAGTYLIRIKVSDNDPDQPLSDTVDVNLEVLAGDSGDPSDPGDPDPPPGEEGSAGGGGGGGCFIETL